MALSHSPKIIKNGLFLCLDAANPRSYSGSGTTWFDLSGKNMNGTLVNGVGYNSSNRGTMTFDGVNDYANFGDIYDDIFVGSNAKFTVSAWVKPNVSNMTNGYIISKWANGSGEWILRVGDARAHSRANFFWSTPSNSAWINQNATVEITNINKWYNLVGVYDITLGPTNSMKIYVDAEDVSTYNENNLGSPTAIENTSASLLIGNRISLDRPFNGSIANVMIYNRALTAAEVKQNFEASRDRYGV